MDFGKPIQKRSAVSKFTEALEAGLKEKGHGSKMGLADHCQVWRTAVMAWRIGRATPLYFRWEQIEEYFDWEPGTIAELLDDSQEKQAL
jgi:hypothetical protein